MKKGFFQPKEIRFSGKLVSVVGNSGSGKTFLTQLLCTAGPFSSCLEQHQERPFQRLFMQDLERYSLPNQVDYLLYRAEQEYIARQNGQTAVLDGGLDLDYHLFTRAFFLNGYLTPEAFGLCRRFYTLLRGLLPPPELVIYLTAPVPLLVERRAARSREIDIARTADLEAMQILLDEWIGTVPQDALIHIDSGGDPGFVRSLPLLLERIRDV